MSESYRVGQNTLNITLLAGSFKSQISHMFVVSSMRKCILEDVFAPEDFILLQCWIQIHTAWKDFSWNPSEQVLLWVQRNGPTIELLISFNAVILAKMCGWAPITMGKNIGRAINHIFSWLKVPKSLKTAKKSLKACPKSSFPIICLVALNCCLRIG